MGRPISTAVGATQKVPGSGVLAVIPSSEKVGMRFSGIVGRRLA